VIQEHRNKSLEELGRREILCSQSQNQNLKKLCDSGTQEEKSGGIAEKCCSCRCYCRGVTSLWESLELSPSFLV